MWRAGWEILHIGTVKCKKCLWKTPPGSPLERIVIPAFSSVFGLEGWLSALISVLFSNFHPDHDIEIKTNAE